ncbi:fluoride efflux transporter FluC [Chondromyces crocatus]|uniref:Fluoride-specific ion channel FluC n=1 Tax=Chondromyces crocatus TaxID=52 RepID=A0A0K1EH50_CHOCO|nr:CrcB family protein [Chondromyces crocatus]AKT40185.1 camphor resistance protein CrcB [Chondromyces crocatus]
MTTAPVWQRLLWICFAGALGSGARFLVSLGAERLGQGQGSFPFGTLIVNVVGSFLICMVMELAAAGLVSPTLRLTLTTGFLGGFTTYSAFAYETLRSAEARQWSITAANLVATLVLGLGAGVLGMICGRKLAGG